MLKVAYLNKEDQISPIAEGIKETFEKREARKNHHLEYAEKKLRSEGMRVTREIFNGNVISLCVFGCDHYDLEKVENILPDYKVRLNTNKMEITIQ